jgi:transcriptional regulator with XRE-family HTH domain
MTDISAPHGAKTRPRWTIGDRIRKARSEVALGQHELAERLGVSAKTVTRWEAGVTQPTAETLTRIADVTQVDPAWLLVGEA